METESESYPPQNARARGKAGLRCVRSVAYGSTDSLHSSPRSRAEFEAKTSLANLSKKHPSELDPVPPIVRHRAAS